MVSPVNSSSGSSDYSGYGYDGSPLATGFGQGGAVPSSVLLGGLGGGFGMPQQQPQHKAGFLSMLGATAQGLFEAPAKLVGGFFHSITSIVTDPIGTLTHPSRLLPLIGTICCFIPGVNAIAIPAMAVYGGIMGAKTAAQGLGEAAKGWSSGNTDMIRDGVSSAGAGVGEVGLSALGARANLEGAYARGDLAATGLERGGIIKTFTNSARLATRNTRYLASDVREAWSTPEPAPAPAPQTVPPVQAQPAAAQPAAAQPAAAQPAAAQPAAAQPAAAQPAAAQPAAAQPAAAQPAAQPAPQVQPRDIHSNLPGVGDANHNVHVDATGFRGVGQYFRDGIWGADGNALAATISSARQRVGNRVGGLRGIDAPQQMSTTQLISSLRNSRITTEQSAEVRGVLQQRGLGEGDTYTPSTAAPEAMTPDELIHQSTPDLVRMLDNGPANAADIQDILRDRQITVAQGANNRYYIQQPPRANAQGATQQAAPAATPSAGLTLDGIDHMSTDELVTELNTTPTNAGDIQQLLADRNVQLEGHPGDYSISAGTDTSGLIHDASTDLVTRLESGQMTPTDAAEAQQVLTDRGITVTQNPADNSYSFSQPQAATQATPQGGGWGARARGWLRIGRRGQQQGNNGANGGNNANGLRGVWQRVNRPANRINDWLAAHDVYYFGGRRINGTPVYDTQGDVVPGITQTDAGRMIASPTGRIATRLTRLNRNLGVGVNGVPVTALSAEGQGNPFANMANFAAQQQFEQMQPPQFSFGQYQQA